jgi:hypothetical protein
MANDFAGGVFQADTFLTSGAAPAQPAGIRMTGGPALTYAVAGLARAGITRAGYYPAMPANRVIVWHNGQNRVFNVWKQTISIADNLYQQADTCTFRTFDWAPEPEDEIIIAAGTRGRRYFGGIVTSVNDDRVTDPRVLLYKVTCQDYMWRVNAHNVMGYWSGVAADIAARDIFRQFAPAGFSTAGFVSPSPSITDMEFDGEGKIGDAMDRITNQIGWRWFMDPYGVAWMFDKQDAMATPLFAAAAGTPYYHFDNLEIQHASDQLKTRVRVKGGGGTTQGPNPAGNVIMTVDTLEYWPDPAIQPFSVYLMGAVYPAVSVNAATKQITIASPGLLRTAPVGTKVNLWVTYDNLDAQAFLRSRGHPDGIIEETLSDERRSYDGAMALAMANGGAFGYPRLTGSYTTVTGRARSGDRLLIHLPYRKIWTEAQVQSVNSVLINAPQYLTRSVQFSDTKLITFQDILRARERARKDR